MLLAYTKHFADLAQQFQLNCPDYLPGLSNGLRPYRNTLICVGATAAACVAIGAAVKALRRRDIIDDHSPLIKDDIKGINNDEPQLSNKQKPLLKQHQVGDDTSDCESDIDTEIANIKLSTSVTTRIQQAFYKGCDSMGPPPLFAQD